VHNLVKLVASIADQPFRAIHKLHGSYHFLRFELSFIKMQGSPEANATSIAEIKIALRDSEIPKGFLQSAECKLATADFLIRRFLQGIGVFARQNRGKDGSGSFNTIALSQKMLTRDSVLFVDEAVYLRFIISLPAKGTGGGVFDAEQSWIMLSQELVAIVGATFFYRNYDDPTRMLLQQFVDVQKIRSDIIRFMQQHDLVAFIVNGSRLPQHSGVDDRPATCANVKTFQSPRPYR
jgi:predicted ABC-class ATPase